MAVKGQIKLDLTDPDFDAVLERYDMLLDLLVHRGVPEEVLLLFADRLRIKKCGCWIWHGDRSELAYGRFSPGAYWADSHRNLAHRASWALFNGELAGARVVDHTCPNRSCVSPYHLQAISHAENVSLSWSRPRLGAICGPDECRPVATRRKKRAVPTGDRVQRWRQNWESLKNCLPDGSIVPDRLPLFAAYVDMNRGPSPDPFRAVDSDCWWWNGAVMDGYGFVTWACPKGTPRLAHLWAYDWFHGKRKKGMHVDHLCRNRACIRPDHLELVTAAENIMRGRGAPALNANKTECDKGHPLSGDNLIVAKSGRRSCRQCSKENNQKSQLRRKEGVTVYEKNGPQCRRGHYYTEENTAFTKTGERRCRKCAAENAVAGRKARKEAEITSSVPE